MSTKMVLLGKVKVLPVEEIFNGKQESKLVVDVRRNFQNSNGDYESDVMSVFLWRGIAEYIKDVLKIGEDIHIIGRYEVHDGRIILFGEQVDLIR
ncbi:MAG: single-stranded DNA-binding protein [Erysipelothrix sp.]|nr:single-stranded DNA-binding protein [Erysipelothrix sp.]